MKNQKSLTLLAIFALIGVGLGVALSQEYYEIRTGLAGFRSFCNISTVMNCDRVAASRFSELIAGIPLSSFATGWYLATFILALIARNRFWRRDSVRALFAMSVVGTLFSVVYFLVMALSLHTYCLLCLGVDLVNIVLLILTLMLKPEGLSVQKPEPDKWKKMGAVVLASLLVSVFGLKAFDSVSMAQADINERVESVLSSPVLPVSVSDTDPSFGPKDAPITIVEFSDFQCPYCRIGATVLKSVLNRYPNQVRVVFRPFPLDTSCNRIITRPMHLSACEAARVGLCAHQQGKFEPVYETLFEHQTEILPGTAAKMAESAGAKADQLAGCIASPEINSELAKDIEEGIQLDVQSTPTFFINGHKILGILPMPFWDQVIEKLQAKK
jgi:protein-disulfide isomerase